ncbi:uncharacterized protein LOC103515998 isoform X2 [Diaphorina citri]|nr:uncharacterized protein LOC103515998 isoform X2 [Diaphorina citri]XP_026684317.1 uncharacterized protein LOC103515998 isoform X2 [Diaphorina citri]XP_026684318.1 uncharacterized protein LOC103515998 isoform X2 [Diaphorina citri]XP_026684319.1 uncharacterized protein LOC103515998 isoform X2 [Diaphorina citri]
MLIWCVLGLIALGKGMAMTIVQEVDVGDMAVLKCPSNDDQHRFQFWELSTKDIIGPGNNINQEKYKYEVLTGTLFIKGVSTQEKGIYTCISKHLDNPTMSAKSVELIVKKDWENVYEEDPSVRIKIRRIYCANVMTRRKSCSQLVQLSASCKLPLARDGRVDDF